MANSEQCFELASLKTAAGALLAIDMTGAVDVTPPARFLASGDDYEASVLAWIAGAGSDQSTLIRLCDPRRSSRPPVNRVFLSAAILTASKRVDAKVYALMKYNVNGVRGSKAINLGTFYLISGTVEGVMGSGIGYYDPITCEVVPTNALFALDQSDMKRVTGSDGAGVVLGGVGGAWGLLVVWNAAGASPTSNIVPTWAALT